MKEEISNTMHNLVTDYKVFVPAVSGGLDSIALTGILLHKGVDVHPVFFRKGQNNYEMEEQAVNYFDRLFQKMFPKNYNKVLKCDMQVPPEAIREFGERHFCSEEATFFFENHVIGIAAIQHALQLQEQRGLRYPPAVVIGPVISDTRIDNSPDLVRSLQFSFRQAFKGVAEINETDPEYVTGRGRKNLTYCAPFLDAQWDKKDYLLWIRKYIPDFFEHLHNTWSCPENRQYHCGKDIPCRKRRDAFRIAEVPDNTIYAD
jgi:7-cyano-7-deazaguanine synthase in queuosine biosynthesis